MFGGSEDKTEREGRPGDGERGGQTEEKIRCEFCREREFSKQTDYFFHLSVFHFKDELMEMFPFKVSLLHLYRLWLRVVYSGGGTVHNV